mmetsp:Transcript_148231/g.476102  ORF Transcript_148231/g.476102 Transcript_148231/m.476102 type:complete len:189 (-) Transcript_148231:930-1496(-)
MHGCSSAQPSSFGDKAEGSVTIDVVRFGSLDGSCSVRYKALNASAHAGVTYEASEGELVFEPGDITKTVDIALLTGSGWSATLEFAVDLLDEQNCELGNLGHCRNKVIDGGTFPSSRFCEQLARGEANQVGEWALFWEYFKWNFQKGGIKERTIIALLMDQLANVYLYATVLCNCYLVNVICHDTGDR